MALELNEAAKRSLNTYRQLRELVKEPVAVDCATAQERKPNLGKLESVFLYRQVHLGLLF